MMIILIIYDHCVSSIHLPHQHIQYPTFADMQQIGHAAIRSNYYFIVSKHNVSASIYNKRDTIYQ